MFIREFMDKLDRQLHSYTFDAYHSLVGQHAASIGLVVMLYFIFLGYRFLMANTQVNITTLLEHMLVVIVCYFLATHWSVFSLLIYNLAMSLPHGVSQALVSVIPGVPTGSEETDLLEYLWFSGLEVAATLWGAISITAIHQGLLALGVLIMTLLLVGYGLLVISLAKMIMAIGLALAPLFILLYMFQRSQSITLGWLSVLLTAMAKQIIIFAMIALVYTLAYDTVECLLSQSSIDMADVSMFLLLLFISFGLFLSTHSIAKMIGKSAYLSRHGWLGSYTNYLQHNFKNIHNTLIRPEHNEVPHIYTRIRRRSKDTAMRVDK